VRELVALVFLLLCFSVAYPLEINFSSHTSLTAAHWAEELELDIGHAGWSVGAGASLEDAGLVEATFGGEYQTSSFSLRVEAGFSDEGFFQLTGSLELFPTESFGIAVEATVDRGGFAGASFILRYGAYANEGGSVATGLLELDEGGNVVGQTLHLDLSFLPWHMGTAVSFGEGGFSSLELGAGVSLEKVEAEARLEWDPTGPYSRGASLSLDLDPLSLSGEATWLVDGSWLAAGALDLGRWLDVRAEVCQTEEASTWELDIGVSFEYVELTLSASASEEGMGYTGGLSFTGDAFSLEFRGCLHPGGEWELELSVELCISLGGELPGG